MQTVEIEVPRRELTMQMAAMRVWLDQNRLEPVSFMCGDGGGEMRVAVSFSAPDEARAFADRFAGQIRTAPPAIVGGLERAADLVG